MKRTTILEVTYNWFYFFFARYFSYLHVHIFFIIFRLYSPIVTRLAWQRDFFLFMRVCLTVFDESYEHSACCRHTCCVCVYTRAHHLWCGQKAGHNTREKLVLTDGCHRFFWQMFLRDLSREFRRIRAYSSDSLTFRSSLSTGIAVIVDRRFWRSALAFRFKGCVIGIPRITGGKRSCVKRGLRE